MAEFTSLNGYQVKDTVARSIAKGRNQAVAFVDYATMIESLNELEKDEYKAGQNIYIGVVGVPDLWVYSVEDIRHTFTYESDEDVVEKLNANTTIQVGFFKLAMLEGQKVDLTTYDQKIAELNDSLVAEDNLKFRFSTDGEGNYGYLKGDDTFVPFSSGGYLALVSKSRTFNITSIVGAENLDKYSENDFVVVGNLPDNNFYQGTSYTYTLQGGVTANTYGYSQKIDDCVLSYNNETGDVTITNGKVRVGYIQNRSFGGNDNYYSDILVPVVVYMIIKTHNANIPNL